MKNMLELVCNHLDKIQARGFTIQSANTIMDARGPMYDRWLIHLYEGGKLVKMSETRTDMVKEEIRDRFSANDPKLIVNMY